MVSENKLLELVRRADPKLAQTLGEIVTSKITHNVYCLVCDKLIGNIMSNGEPKEILSDGSGLLSMRKRFDGNYGFECMCGNDSRLADQEKGIIGSQKPSKEDLAKVWENLNKKQTIPLVSKKGVEVDRFLLEEVK